MTNDIRTYEMKRAMEYFSLFTREGYTRGVVGSINYDPSGNWFSTVYADYILGYNIYSGYFEVEIYIPFEGSEYYRGFKTFMEAKAFIYKDILSR